MTPLSIKVCGMTEAENIREVEQLGVDMIGFIFYPKSPPLPMRIARLSACPRKACRRFCQ